MPLDQIPGGVMLVYDYCARRSTGDDWLHMGPSIIWLYSGNIDL